VLTAVRAAAAGAAVVVAAGGAAAFAEHDVTGGDLTVGLVGFLGTAAAAQFIWHTRAVGVGGSGGVVVCVREGGEGLGVAGLEEGVDGEESADGGVVFAGAEVDEAGGGVVVAADVGLLAGPSKHVSRQY
jgi:hypothetical protein